MLDWTLLVTLLVLLIVVVGEIVRIVLVKNPMGSLVILKDNENRIADAYVSFNIHPKDLKNGQYYTIKIVIKK